MKIVFNLVVVLCTTAAAPASAREQPLRFVHALQENGYGDMAAEYLRLVAQRPNLPAELRDVWDLEMSNSLKAAAAIAFDAKEHDELEKQSQEHLSKFIREKPDHPRATAAVAAWGNVLVQRALESLRVAKADKRLDRQEQAKRLGDASAAALAQAREKFQETEKKFRARLAALPPPSKLPTKKADRAESIEVRQQAEIDLGQAELQLALIEYYLAQTHADSDSAERTAALTKAAQGFDGLYQRNRGNVVGLYAHMWHGKIIEELGDLRMALDIYDEVLVHAPEPADRGPATGLEPLLAEAARLRLNVVAKQRPEQFLPEATAWLKEYRRLRQTDGYQGVALSAARAILAAAAKATGPERTRLTAEALQLTTDCAKVRSTYQRQLVLARQEILKTAGRHLTPSSVEEAVALGDAAAGTADWRSALDAYGQAVQMADKQRLNIPARVAEAREGMDRARLMLARELLDQGKFRECLDLADKLVHDEQGRVRKESATAAQASAVSVSAALNLFAAASDGRKPAALRKLLETAELTEITWPERPEADYARMARGQAKLVVGQLREAIPYFERINLKSPRYATALYWAGQSYWRLYLAEKSQEHRAASKDRMTEDRAKGQGRLQSALDVFSRQLEPGQAMPPLMREAQLLLAEIHHEGGQPEQSAVLYRPLVDAVQARDPPTFDLEALRILRGAMRAYCALGEPDKAAAAIAPLLDRGPDTPQVNEVLIEFAKSLSAHRHNAATGGRDLLSTILLRLAQRKQLGLGQMIFVGETLNALDMTAEAGQQFQQILERTEGDPEFARQAQKAMGLLRTELLKALRRQKKYDEALKQVEQLIKENPKALEPLMEKGRILEARAEADPAKLDEAVDHWTLLRTRLQATRKKPDEYYEAIYNTANCLVRQAELGKGQPTALDRARKAEQVLKATLVLSPDLSGPDAVARYKSLLNRAISLQGRSPDVKADNQDSKK